MVAMVIVAVVIGLSKVVRERTVCADGVGRVASVAVVTWTTRQLSRGLLTGIL